MRSSPRFWIALFVLLALFAGSVWWWLTRISRPTESAQAAASARTGAETPDNALDETRAGQAPPPADSPTPTVVSPYATTPSSTPLPREPRGLWAATVPAPLNYVDRLPPEHRTAFENFRAAYPSVDPTETEAFHEALLEERRRYGLELSEASGVAFTDWLRPTERMQAALVVARGEHIGIAINGTDARGRGYTLVGFRGVDPIYSFTQNTGPSRTTGANLLRANEAFDPVVGAALTGDGLYVNVNDHGTIYEHTEFQLPNSGGSRIVYKEINDGGDRDHMTHVAGTVGAWGYTATLMGMVPRVWFRSLIQQSTSHIYGYGMQWPGQKATSTNPRTGQIEFRSVMGTTSLGLTDSTGQYTSTAALYDQVMWDYPYYIHFYAASNDGSGMRTLGANNPIAKNITTIAAADAVTRDANGNYVSRGSVAGFSSRGPTLDGRIKPDLTANGTGVTSTTGSTGTSTYQGTSMATPNASGSTVLLIDYVRQRFPGHYLRSSTLRALLVNTADDRGRQGPDYEYGWGVMNVHRAAVIVKRYADTPATRVVLEDRLASGQTWTASYVYDGTGPLRVTLAWIDLPGSASTTTAPNLVNNLDLRVTGPTGTTHLPFIMPYTTGQGATPAYDASLYTATATTGNNVTDNIEQVLISSPPAGTYTVSVSHTGSLSGGSQCFSLAVLGAAQTAALGPIDILDCTDCDRAV